jgi:hypothetical protein
MDKKGQEMENTAEQVDIAVDDTPEQLRADFGTELEKLINRYSIENKSNTPDFILGEFMLHCLAAFEATSLRRESWFGVSLDIAQRWDERIMQAVGEASMCWSNIGGAGVFDSEKAKQVGNDLLKYLTHCDS